MSEEVVKKVPHCHVCRHPGERCPGGWGGGLSVACFSHMAHLKPFNLSR